MNDKINPDHYKVGTPYECRVVIEQYGWDKDHCLASAFEYMCRAGKKVGESEADDLRKAVWNLQRKIDRLSVDKATVKPVWQNVNISLESFAPTPAERRAVTKSVASHLKNEEHRAKTKRCANATSAERVHVARAAYKEGKRGGALVQHVARHCGVRWAEASALLRELGYVKAKRGDHG